MAILRKEGSPPLVITDKVKITNRTSVAIYDEKVPYHKRKEYRPIMYIVATEPEWTKVVTDRRLEIVDYWHDTLMAREDYPEIDTILGTRY